MKSDFSRPTFNETRHYTRLLFQQGRPPLDADFNEQSEIQVEMLRTYARDIIGEHGGTPGAFLISLPEAGFDVNAPDFGIGAGHYYVDGMLCNTDTPSSYLIPLFPRPVTDAPPPVFVPTLVYLDVWEHHRTWIDDGVIVDPALGGSDTATRSRVVWQVRLLALTKEINDTFEKTITTVKKRDLAWKRVLEVNNEHRGQLRVRITPGGHDNDCCKAHAETRYRGIENQLYRVEIHHGEAALPAGTDTKDKILFASERGKAATFKWSRENGSVAAKWLKGGKCDAIGAVTLRVLGPRDQAHGFAAGQWIEVTDETRELRGEPGCFAHIARVEGDTLTLDAPLDPKDPLPDWTTSKNPKVRRWDQQNSGDGYFEKGAVIIRENVANANKDLWIKLENGLEIQFVSDGTTVPTYRTGDYWLIPVRVATGDILWPWKDPSSDNADYPEKILPPAGIKHYYAPLALIKTDGMPVDLRREFEPMAKSI